MAHLFGTGVEMGSLTVFGSLRDSPSLNTSTVRTGVYSMYAPATGGAIVTVPYCSALQLGVGVYPTANASTGSGMVANIVGIQNIEGVLVVGAGFDPGTNALIAFLVQDGAYNYSVIGYGPLMPLNNWYYVELVASAVTVGDVTTVTVAVYLDGVQVISGSDNTTVNNAGYWLYTGFGRCGGSFNASQRSVVGFYDDFKVNDTNGVFNSGRVGRGGFHWVPVTGVGAVTEFTPSIEADNYTMVDEVPANDDTDYVFTDAANQIDTYKVTIPEGAIGNVSSAIWWAQARTIESGGGNIAPVLRIDGINHVAGQKGLDVTYRYVGHVYSVNPATSQPWTLDDLAGIEVGQKSIG